MKIALRAAFLASLLAATGVSQAQVAPAPEDLVVVINNGIDTYRVPYRYLSIRPPPQAVEAVNHWRRFSFAFWMPDGRPSLRAGHELGNPRPLEPGRPAPGPEEFVFIATNVTSWRDPEPAVRPSARFENSLIWKGTAGYDFESRWGMLVVTPKPGTASTTDVYYGLASLGAIPVETSVHMNCPRPGSPGNNAHTVHRLCSGMVSVERLQVTFFVQIPLERMDRLMDALGVATGLLTTWVQADIRHR